MNQTSTPATGGSWLRDRQTGELTQNVSAPAGVKTSAAIPEFKTALKSGDSEDRTSAKKEK